MENENYLLNTIKGLADTDFSLMLYRNRKMYPHYPVISITSADKKFVVLISKFLVQQGFNVDLILEDNIRSRLRLSGRQIVLKEIGRPQLKIKGLQ